MNKRDLVLSQLSSHPSTNSIPAAFFLHFDQAYQAGQAAIDKHLEFFHYTGMDFVKIQYEQTPPPSTIHKPEDWVNAPRCPEAFFETSIRIAEGLVKAAKGEALVVMTLYSPFMWAKQVARDVNVNEQLKENPEAVKKGLAILTENVLTLVRGCQQVGVDGFYVSSQGGEALRFKGTDIFQKYIKPTDLAVWAEVQASPFNILHICNYEAEYDDLTPFFDYPGQVVNCSLKLGQRVLTPSEVSQMFGRPFMGGLERKGVLATGGPEAIGQAVRNVLAQAPDRFILAADCTVPGDTPWEYLKTAIDLAHQYRR